MSGATCLWRNANFGGGHVVFYQYIPDLGLHSFDGTNANNAASSIFNNGRSDRVYFYDSTYKNGRRGWNDKGSYWTNLADAYRGPGLTWNDAISSIYFATYN
jgi:hypothetical protein